MIKQALIAMAAFGAVAVSSPADAHHDRVRASVVISYGSPGYYGGYYDPYHDPYYYRPRYYHYEPRYRYRPRYYHDDRYYYRPHKRHWKKRHWRRYHDRW
jgi:hypothetical protein